MLLNIGQVLLKCEYLQVGTENSGKSSKVVGSFRRASCGRQGCGCFERISMLRYRRRIRICCSAYQGFFEYSRLLCRVHQSCAEVFWVNAVAPPPSYHLSHHECYPKICHCEHGSGWCKHSSSRESRSLSRSTIYFPSQHANQN